MKPIAKNTTPDSRPMHKANCAECKRNCEVPFKPTGSKPVLCRDCFSVAKGSGEPRGFKNANKPHPAPQTSFEERQLRDLKSQLESLHLKTDSLVRAVKEIVKYLKATEDQVSLKDVMQDVGVIESK